MMWIEPVADRTQAGQYLADDLNRVGNDVEYLAEQFNLYGYYVVVDAKTDWIMSDLPYRDLMQTYLANIQALLDVYYTMPNTPTLPTSMEKLTWQNTNSIEQNLASMKEVLGYMIQGFRYCGGFNYYSGSEVLLP